MTINREPTAISAAVKEAISAVVKLVVIFGIIQITTEQFGVLMLAVDSVLGLLLVLFLRPQVTPVASPQLPTGTEVVTTDPASGEVTGLTTI